MTAAVLEYHLVSYRRTWRGSVLSSFVLPILFVIGFGYSVGTLVDASGRLGGGETYMQFIVPGMIASTAMQVAFGEATFPVMARFQWIRTYQAMSAAPLRIADILGGDLLFLILRVVSTSAVFLLITSLFGGVASWWGLLVLPITALIGLAFAAPMFAITGHVESTVHVHVHQPVRGHPDVAVRRRVLQRSHRSAGACAGSPTSRRCGTVSNSAAPRPAPTTVPCSSRWAMSRTCCCGPASVWSSPIARSRAGCRARRRHHGGHRVRARRLRAARQILQTRRLRHRTQRHGAAVGVLDPGRVRILRTAALPALYRRRRRGADRPYHARRRLHGELRAVRGAGHARVVGDDRGAVGVDVQLLRQDERREALRRRARHTGAPDGNRVRRTVLGHGPRRPLLGGVRRHHGVVRADHPRSRP